MKESALFTGLAENYGKGRPAYAAELIDHMIRKIGVSPRDLIADIGAGTGIFSRQLLERGCRVVCVEPNHDMRAAAQQTLQDFPGAMFTDGNAEATKLEASSVRFITVAQAFHWFDVEQFRMESRRILKSCGISMLIWNSRELSTAFNGEHHAICEACCPAFRGFNGGTKKDDVRIQQYFSGTYQYAEFDHPLFYDKEQFISRCLSSSYSIKESTAGYIDYLQALNALFDKYAENGILAFPNQSVVYWGRV